MDQGKVKAIEEWPLPQSVKELQRFLDSLTSIDGL